MAGLAGRCEDRGLAHHAGSELPMLRSRRTQFALPALATEPLEIPQGAAAGRTKLGALHIRIIVHVCVYIRVYVWTSALYLENVA